MACPGNPTSQVMELVLVCNFGISSNLVFGDYRVKSLPILFQRVL